MRNTFNRYKKAKKIMQECYPLLFANDKKPVPLAIGIFHQIKEDSISGLSSTYLRDFLQIWCNRIEYVKKVRYATLRFDLDGSISMLSTVTPDQRKIASKSYNSKIKRLKRSRCYKLN